MTASESLSENHFSFRENIAPVRRHATLQRPYCTRDIYVCARVNRPQTRRLSDALYGRGHLTVYI